MDATTDTTTDRVARAAALRAARTQETFDDAGEYVARGLEQLAADVRRALAQGKADPSNLSTLVAAEITRMVTYGGANLGVDRLIQAGVRLDEAKTEAEAKQ